MGYLLDSNVFIQAKNLHYGFDFCPAFWDWIDVEHEAGRVASIEKVRGELVGGDDDLAEWAKVRPDSFFVAPDAAVLQSLGEVSAWAPSAGYEGAAVSTFLQGADFYLVAHARAHGQVVVTHEVTSEHTEARQDPERVYRSWRELRHALRDAEDLEGPVCAPGRESSSVTLTAREPAGPT